MAALLLLALYTLGTVIRLYSRPPVDVAGPTVASAADLLATRLQGRIDQQQAALAAGREALIRSPEGPPIDAAEAVLRAGGAEAAAVWRPEGLVAQAGEQTELNWPEALKSATTQGTRPWAGSAPGGGRFVYVLAPGGQPGEWIGSAIDAGAGLADTGAAGPLGVAAADGRILALGGAGTAGQGFYLFQGFGIEPTVTPLAGTQVLGRLPGGGPAHVAVRRLESGLLVVAALSASSEAGAAQSERLGDLLLLLAPLAAGIALALVLRVQSRRAEAAKQAQAAGEERFRLAVEAARCGIWEWDLDADQLTMSEVTAAMLGFGGGGFASGQDVLNRVSAEHRGLVRAALANAAAFGGFDVSFRVPGIERGHAVWVDARGQGLGPMAAEGYRRIIGVALDVTEERRSQDRALAAETRLRDAIESVSEAFALWDRSGRLLMCNQNYCRFFDLAPDLVKPGVGRDHVNRFVSLAIRSVRPVPEGVKGEREVELNDGRWVQISERRTAEGGLVMTAADITLVRREEEARRLNEAELQKAVTNLERSRALLTELARKYEAEKLKAEEGNKAKSDFLANMSHELRTPLNAINGFSEMMVGEMFGPLGDRRYRDYAADILNSGQHLLALINDILDMSKIEAGKMSLKFELLSLEDVSDDALRLIRNRAEAAGLSLAQDFPPMPEVEADYRAIKQILLNLLSNAVKFTPRGGRITVRAERRGTGLHGEQVALVVQDTGVGISAEDLQRLGRPFEQVESQHAKTRQGTGLGLALTKALVELHNGDLRLDSAEGQGTTVTVLLPIEQTGGEIARAGVAA